MNSSGENWYVKLANGDVHNVTVDQLDWAFEQGHIDANTLVLADEAQGWVRLGEVAGLDEAPAPAAAPARAPVPVAAPVRAVAPAPAVAPTPTPMVAAYTPAPRPAAYAPSFAPAANSLRPYSMDTNDFDLNDAQFRKRSGKGWVVAVLSLVVMGSGVGLAATRMHGGSAPAPEAAAAQAPPPAETHIPYQTPTPVAATVAPPPGDSPLNPRFTQAQKDQLLKADKQHEDKSKAQAHASSPSPGGHSSTKYKSIGFTTGGNKYDPLNSSL
jgi:hypothetical protein